MTDENTSKDREIVAIYFEPAKRKEPALLDIAVRNEDGRVETITLQGKAATKLSHLKAGDLYRDAPRPAEQA